jgi:hypothetical protein
MCAVTRDFYFALRVFAALAAILLVIHYRAAARGMRTFFRLYVGHDFFFPLSKVYGEKCQNNVKNTSGD